jgi:hypothetical protein
MNKPPPLRQVIQCGGGVAIVCLAALIPERGLPNDRLLTLGGAAIGTIFIVHAALSGMRRPSGQASGDGLDRVLFHWDEENVFTERDLLAGGVGIYGMTGSGKTSSSGRVLAEALVNRAGSGGLIVAAKPGEDRAMWQKIFRDAGRADDLLIFSPEHHLRFNFLDFEMSQGGETRNLTKCITVIGETLRSADMDKREAADFWQRETERMIFNAVEVVKRATGRVTAPDLHRFLVGAATHPSQFTSDEWLAGFHNQCLKAAWGKPKSPVERHDFDLAKEYFLGELPNMADKTRSSIMVGALGLLHVFNVGTVRELVSTTTNVRPDDLFRGRWLLIDMPVSRYGDVGAFVIGGWKYLVQRAILARVASADTPPVVVWCDEAQTAVTSFDAHFLAQCRSHHGCMVMLSQSLPGYYAALGGQNGKQYVDALQASLTTKVFHALGDLETANWASGLVGRSLTTFTGGSSSPSDGAYQTLLGGSQFSSNFSEAYENTLQTNDFMHGLRTGGPRNGFVCDCFVIRSGQPFASGNNWLATSFSQKGGAS